MTATSVPDKSWDQLSRRRQIHLWRHNDERVPPGWVPSKATWERVRPNRPVQRGPWNMHLSDEMITAMIDASIEPVWRRSASLREVDGVLVGWRMTPGRSVPLVGAVEDATVIAFWIDRDLKTMPAFTTNIEVGLFAASGKCVIGYPDPGCKMSYIQRLAERYRIPVYPTLAATMTAAMVRCGA